MPQGIALFVGRVQPAGHFNAGKAMRVSPALRVFAKTAIPAVPNEQIAGTRHAGAPGTCPRGQSAVPSDLHRYTWRHWQV
jgi:hypothetical protein